ncbi:MAG: hypothetical protein EOO73_15455 [Myxococcales bacterium]|nr:MAG: hypothetical protein EOO73_15455 [Myxococcales bacterium]
MRVFVGALALWGCSVLPVSALIRSPVDNQCHARGLKGCPELVEGAIAYVEGDHATAREKLKAARSKNTPEQLRAFAIVLREVARSTDAARPLADVAALLTEDARPDGALPGAAEAPPATAAALSAVAVPTPHVGSSAPARPSGIEDRKLHAQRLALYALTAREDPARRHSETIELAEATGTACQVAGSEALCLRRQKGPFVVTDVVTSEECGWRVFLAVSDSDTAAPAFGFDWLVPARAQGTHGASFALKGGQWLYVAVKAAKPSPSDRGCFVTWSGFQPRLVPSLAGESDDDVLNPYRFRD